MTCLEPHTVLGGSEPKQRVPSSRAGTKSAEPSQNQHGVVSSTSTATWVQSQPCHLLAKHFPSLYLSFPIWKVELILVPASWGCCEDRVSQ